MPAITVKLNDVKKGDVVFESLDISISSKIVEDHYDKMTEKSDTYQKKLEYEIGRVNHDLVDAKIEFKNAMIAAALTAYNHHLPLELAPDDIWTLIALGVAQHLGGDKDLAETYRKTFVDHKGKKELIVDGTGLVNVKSPDQNKSGWPAVIAMICQLIKKNTKTDLADIITGSFSTTGPTETAVYHCMLMETMKNYFDYKCILACGIPEIILQGDVQDWESILKRLKDLNELFPDFSWYLTRIADHVTKMVSTVKGNEPDLEWWNTMILKKKFGSGGQTMLTGWLGDFFPYIFHPDGERVANKNKPDFDNLNCPAVTLTDFVLVDYDETEYKMKLCGGFLGISQNKETKAVRPSMGWVTYYHTTPNKLTPSNKRAHQISAPSSKHLKK